MTIKLRVLALIGLRVSAAAALYSRKQVQSVTICSAECSYGVCNSLLLLPEYSKLLPLDLTHYLLLVVQIGLFRLASHLPPWTANDDHYSIPKLRDHFNTKYKTRFTNSTTLQPFLNNDFFNRDHLTLNP